VLGGVTVATSPISGGAASASFPASVAGSLAAVYSGDSTYPTAESNVIALSVSGAILQFTPASVTTFAGVPSPGQTCCSSGDIGPASDARLSAPQGVALDSFGNVYFADSLNNYIRRVDAVTGIVSDFVGVPYQRTGFGTCAPNGDGGLGSAASLCAPSGIAFDANNNLFFSDTGNDTVRRVDAITHIITTVAGITGQTTFDGDGQATAVHLNKPYGLAFDSNGNLYIADYGDKLVRELTPSGTLTTVAGNYYGSSFMQSGANATSGFLTGAAWVALDAANNLYISDNSSRVWQVNSSGILNLYAGSGNVSTSTGDGGPATSAYLGGPWGIAFDPAGNLYISDVSHFAVRVVNAATGIISTYVGTDAQGPGNTLFASTPSTSVGLTYPFGLAFDANGSLYIADQASNTILKASAGSMQFAPGQAAGQTLTLSNISTTPLTFASTPYTVSGNYSVGAAAANPCNFAQTLAAGATCSVQVTPFSVATGQTGSIAFADSALGTPQPVSLATASGKVPTSTILNITYSTMALGGSNDLGGQVETSGSSSSAPTGSISYYDGSTFLASVPLTSGGELPINYSGPLFPYVSLAPGVHFITAGYGGDANYAPSFSARQEIVVTTSGTVNSQTVSINPVPAQSYANTSFTVSGNATSGLPVSYIVLSGPATGSNPFTIAGAGTVVIQANQTGSASYSAAPPVTVSVPITPVALTITANNASRTYGQLNPVFTYTPTGLVHGDTIASLTGAPSLTTTAVGTSPQGSYVITAAQGSLASPNYTFSFVSGTLTVTGVSAQTIMFPPIPNLPIGVTMTLTARASSGLPVTYSVSGPATINGDKVTPTGAGLVTVTANQSGNSNYAAAQPVAQSFTAP